MKASLTLAAALLAVIVSAQDNAPKAELKFDKAAVTAGSTVKGKIVLILADGLHAYQNPPSDDTQIPVQVEPVKGTTLVKAIYPKGEPYMASTDPKPIMVYKGEVEIPVLIKAPAKAGKHPVKLVITYQQCNDTACFPPGKLNVSGALNVVMPPKKKKTL